MENKANVSLALLEKITEESFAKRRKHMHDTVKKFSKLNWEGFDDSLGDFEARNFGYLYELIGQLAREGIADLKMVINALQYLVVVDWEVFQPFVEHIMQRYNVKFNEWSNFQWLAEETRKRFDSS